MVVEQHGNWVWQDHPFLLRLRRSGRGVIDASVEA
jgi:hypothetical protein